MTKRLTIGERMATCAVSIPQSFIYYDTPLGKTQPHTKITIDMPLVWARLRPDIANWIEGNIKKKARIRIINRCGGSWIVGKELACVFDDPKDAVLFKMFWI